MPLCPEYTTAQAIAAVAGSIARAGDGGLPPDIVGVLAGPIVRALLASPSASMITPVLGGLVLNGAWAPATLVDGIPAARLKALTEALCIIGDIANTAGNTQAPGPDASSRTDTIKKLDVLLGMGSKPDASDRLPLFNPPPPNSGGGQDAAGGEGAGRNSEARPTRLPRLDTLLPESAKNSKDRALSIGVDRTGKPTLEVQAGAVEVQAHRKTLPMREFMKATRLRGTTAFTDLSEPDGVRSDYTAFVEGVLDLWETYPPYLLQDFFSEVCDAVHHGEQERFDEPARNWFTLNRTVIAKLLLPLTSVGTDLPLQRAAGRAIPRKRQRDYEPQQHWDPAPPRQQYRQPQQHQQHVPWQRQDPANVPCRYDLPPGSCTDKYCPFMHVGRQAPGGGRGQQQQRSRSRLRTDL